ncbi:MAG TPA: glycerophosphodiester phosphodiesterase family protein, partial [Bacteroidota bacterium]|nr:glycerophosphodiester phosphodiesterase family protein [Bacteroidota bacterium]
MVTRAFFPRPEPGSPPYVIAHRGISAKAPENTLASFALAVEAGGIDMVELDVRLTKDREVIVLHDRTLQRTTTGNGIARKFSYQEISKYDAGSWFNPSFRAERVPLLQQVLKLVGPTRWVNIEIKSEPFHRETPGLIEQRVLDAVAESGMEQGVFFSSFDHHLIANLKRIAPTTFTGV